MEHVFPHLFSVWFQCVLFLFDGTCVCAPISFCLASPQPASPPFLLVLLPILSSPLTFSNPGPSCDVCDAVWSPVPGIGTHYSASLWKTEINISQISQTNLRHWKQNIFKTIPFAIIINLTLPALPDTLWFVRQIWILYHHCTLKIQRQICVFHLIHTNGWYHWNMACGSPFCR